MIADVRHNLQAVPFEPFAIITSSGHRYEVPTADRASITPPGSRFVVWFDDGSSVNFPPYTSPPSRNSRPGKTADKQIRYPPSQFLCDFPSALSV